MSETTPTLRATIDSPDGKAQVQIRTQTFNGFSSFPPKPSVAAGIYIEWYRGDLKDYNLVNSAEATDAYVISFTYTDPNGGPVSATEFLTSNESEVFCVIQFLTTQDTSTVYSKTIQDMINSFNFA